jgi:peptidoglycan/LPS O-acetylase OafA/YrhL
MRTNYIVDKSLSDFNFVIEAWRGFAAVLVMICHYRIFWVTGPSYFDLTATGVDLFFVLSGYVFAPTILTNIGSYWSFMLFKLMIIQN